MALFLLLLGLALLLLHSGRKKQTRFKTELHVTIPLDDDDDAEDLLANLRLNVPPGVTIDHLDIDARICDAPDDES